MAVDIDSFPAIGRDVSMAEAPYGDKNRALIVAVF